MSLIRAQENNKQLADNPNRFFTFRGSQATGDSGGKTNNVWNFESLCGKGQSGGTPVSDVNNNKMDFVDFWPEYGEIGVFVNGVMQHDRQAWTLQSHTGAADATLTFFESIPDDAYVTFFC